MVNLSVPLSLPQKAAAILSAMDREHAKKILSYFKPDDVKALMHAAGGLQDLPGDILDRLVDEFEQECSKGVGISDSSNSIQSLIEETLTPEEMAEMNGETQVVSLDSNMTPIWDLLDGIENDKLSDFLIHENSDAAGYILTRLPPKSSASIIATMTSDSRQRIVADMITTRPALPEAVQMIEGLVRQKFERALNVDKNAGSQRLVAGMLNELDTDVSENLFTELAEVVQPGSLNSVKSLMFRFEDLITLEPSHRAIIFDQISTEVTTLALRDTDEALTEAVLSSLGQRARRMLEAELKRDAATDPEEIKEAKKQISSTVLSLASQGTITIPSPEEETQ